jgi:hypothetical protein
MQFTLPEIDNLIHAPIRLAVMTVLNEVEWADFKWLQDITQASDGNLASHLRTLENAQYIQVDKTFQGRRPQTRYAISNLGRSAYLHYLSEMDAFLTRHANPAKQGDPHDPL